MRPLSLSLSLSLPFSLSVPLTLVPSVSFATDWIESDAK